jgi:hypothetical protein
MRNSAIVAVGDQRSVEEGTGSSSTTTIINNNNNTTIIRVHVVMVLIHRWNLLGMVAKASIDRVGLAPARSRAFPGWNSSTSTSTSTSTRRIRRRRRGSSPLGTARSHPIHPP